MKRYFIIFSSLLGLFVTSCAKESQSLPQRTPLEFTANFADIDSKTVVGNNGKIYWCPGDAIKIFQGDIATGKFTSTNTENVLSTRFKGYIDTFVGEINEGTVDSYFTALYPYSDNTTFNSEDVTLNVNVFDNLSAVAGTFPSGSFPSIAKSGTMALAFYNVCGGIIFTVENEGITKVVFGGNNNENVAGETNVGFEGNIDAPDAGQNEGISIDCKIPAVKNFIDGKKCITITPPVGTESFIPGEEYYVPTYPTIFNKGFYIQFYKGNLVAKYVDESNKTIRRSMFAKLINKDSGLPFVGPPTPPEPERIDLSLIDPITGNTIERETANCYIIRNKGDYMFPLVYGNAIMDGKDNKYAYTIHTSDEIYNGSNTMYWSVTRDYKISKDYIDKKLVNENGILYKQFVNFKGHNITNPYIYNDEDVTGKLSLELLWEEKEGMIQSLALSEDKTYCNFTCSELDCNALIALKNDSDIVWSWHIWGTTQNLAVQELFKTKDGYRGWEKEGFFEEHSFLNVNLGATAEDPYGLYYNWGRKDPISPIAGFTMETLYDTREKDIRNIEDFIKNPTKVYNNVRNIFFNHSTKEQTYLFLWNNSVEVINCEDWSGQRECHTVKTIYDPSPIGFNMPETLSLRACSEQFEATEATIIDFSGFKIPLAGFKYYPVSYKGIGNKVVGRYWLNIARSGDQDAYQYYITNEGEIQYPGKTYHVVHSYDAMNNLQSVRPQKRRFE